MSPKSMKMAAERKKPAMRAVKPMNAKTKRAVRMKPACRALEPMMATEGLFDDGSEPSKDDEIVELRVQVKCCHWELSQLRDEGGSCSGEYQDCDAPRGEKEAGRDRARDG